MTAPGFQPAHGAPPTLEWVPIDRLLIDDTYQRGIETTRAQALIARIAHGWDWRLFQPLSVSRRPDGQMFVIDGQHRLAAARRRPDLPHLPCIISAMASDDQEAKAFAALNRERRALTRLEVYRAELAAGEPRAVLAAGLISAAGLQLARHTNTKSWPPGTIDCIGAVIRAVAQYGQAHPGNALVAMGEAWAARRITCGSSVFTGLVDIFHNPPPGFYPDALIDALAETTGADLHEEAGDLRRLYTNHSERMRAAILARVEA